MHEKRFPRVLIVGSNSDLIAEFREDCQRRDIELLPLTRKDWDLRIPTIPKEVKSKIESFVPTDIVFSAAINNKWDSKKKEDDLTVTVQHHLQVNCISILTLVEWMQRKLPSKLVSIHVITSLYGIYGRKQRLPYSVSKHALEGAIKCLALEYPSTLTLGYRPGFFKTKLTDINLSGEQQERIKCKIPIGRLGISEDLSRILISNILNPPFYSTGSTLTIDGGLSSGGFFDS